jgi:anaerobic magnesium-protoporphyrin IX monomethyl ester cyclase
MMQLLLTTLNAKYIHTNLAIRLLYQLNKNKGNVSWKEFTIKQTVAEIVQVCMGYDVITFSCYIWNINQTLEVAKALKAINPEIKIVLGGPEVSYDWQEVLLLTYVDFIIVGEGEIPFSYFLENYPNLKDATNIAYKYNGQIFFRADSVSFDLTNYDQCLPYVDDDLPSLKHKILYVESSRGCPYKCEFCLASLDNKVRQLPIEAIKKNLLFLMQHGSTIKFLDRTFNVRKDFTIDIFQFILANHQPGNVFQFEITADIVHPDIIKFIEQNVRPGIFRFEIGIQTVNQKANLAVSRKQNFEKTSSIIKQLQPYIAMHLDLIVGLPHDYWDDIKDSFNQVLKLHPMELQLGFLKFLKGTPVRQKYLEHGYVFDEKAPYQIKQSNFLSTADLQQLTLLEAALEIYWNKPRAISLLKYITKHHDAFDFLLQLGNRFAATHSLHAYGLKEVYQILKDELDAAYAHRPVFKTLAAIDYHLQHKVKPYDLFEVSLPKQAHFECLEQLQLNAHLYRFAIIPIDHEAIKFLNIVPLLDQYLVIQFNGRENPIILNQLQSVDPSLSDLVVR